MDEEQQAFDELLAVPAPAGTTNSLQWAESVAVVLFKHYQNEFCPFETNPGEAVEVIDAFSTIIRRALPPLIDMVRANAPAKAIRQKDYHAYMRAVVAIDKRHSLYLGAL